MKRLARLLCWIVGTHDYYLPRMTWVDNGPKVMWDVVYEMTCSRCGREVRGSLSGLNEGNAARLLR
jgi:hypothetical protein